MKTEITKKSDTEITINGSLPAETVEAERSEALKMLGKDLKLPGFRPGKIPEKILMQNIDQSVLWQEMANRSLSKALPKIVEEQKLRVIGRPHINVTKLAPDNPLEFTVEFSILPEIVLPDYKTIAQKENGKKKDEDLTEKELEEATENIRKRVADTEAGPQKEGEEKKDAPLPELNDELVKKLGPYESVADFKEKLKEQLKHHKVHMAREKNRLAILEEVIKEVKPKVPNVLVEAELDKMLAQMRADIQRAGMDVDTYFEQVKKTEEDFRKDWKGDAEKRAQIQLILNEIAKEENITADEKEVEGQTRQLLAQHPPQKGDLREAEIATKIYVATQLTNERVFEFLENQK